MDFLELMETLPVTIPAPPGTPETAYALQLGEVVVIASHFYHAPLGRCGYILTFRGDGWKELLLEAIGQLGNPDRLRIKEDNLALASWPSPSQETPDPDAWRHVGDEMIESLAQELELSVEELALAKRVLIIMQATPDQFEDLSFKLLYESGIGPERADTVVHATRRILAESCRFLDLLELN